MKDKILIKKEGEIMTIYLNRPEKRNALDPETMDALPRAFSAASEDADVKVIILAGVGEVFSAGIDLFSYPDLLMGKKDEGTSRLREYISDMHHGLNKIESLEKPVICAINRYVVGMGLELALTADFRIAGEDAIFGMPEVQLGLIPDVGGTTRLTRLIGIVKAKELIMTGKMIDAKEALRIDLVNEIVPPGEELKVARKLAHHMIKNCSPAAVGLAKKIIDLSEDLDKNTSLEMEGIFQSILFQNTDDLVEGFMARVKRRRPNFE